MSAIHLGIVNEVETASSQSQLMLLILIAPTPGCHYITVVHVRGVCSALVLSHALSSRGEARSNLVCHPLERVLCAATCHVTLPDAPCLPAARLLTTWPVTPVPCSPLTKSGVCTMTPANPGCSLCLASYSCCSLSSWLPVHGMHVQRHRVLDGFV
jgi:hypothetical protein